MEKLNRQFWPWAMLAGLLAFYLFLLTTNYYWDGIFFAQVIEDARGLDSTLLHPNHLLYNVLGYLIYRAVRVFGFEPRAVRVLQVTNCFISVASAYVLLRILLVAVKSVYLSVVLTLLFALSATWWKFSTDADSYIPSVLFLLISFYLVLPFQKPRPFLLAVSFSLSMLFHQLAIFFFPVAVLGIIQQTAGAAARSRLTSVMKFAVSAFLITFPIFVISFYLVTGGFALRPFFSWITTFSPEHGFTFNAWDNFSYTLRGHSRLFVGGRMAFLRELKSPFMYTMLALLAGLTAIFFYKVLRHLKEARDAIKLSLSEKAKLGPLRLLCCLWIVCYLVFLFFFIPQNTFYRLFYLPALIVLAATLLAPYELSYTHVHRHRTAIFVAMVIVANLTFSAYPYALVRTNPPLELSLRMNKVWRAETVVYFAAWNTDNSLVKYFNPSVSWVEADREHVEKDIAGGVIGNREAWLDTTFIQRMEESDEGRRWLDTHTIKNPDYQLVNNKYRLQFFRLNPDSFVQPRTTTIAP